ncbi:MAG: hypothetical protein LBK53_08735 [Heliobacteriaceae bacterium]|jgi:hypothetical protein|nr:hypothetical protein [Heliobacteriaceae bacterium]
MNKQIKTIMLIGMMLAAATIAHARPECESYGLNGYCNKWKDGADAIVTSYRIIENKRLEYEKESGQLSSKKKLGLDVDDNKIRILIKKGNDDLIKKQELIKTLTTTPQYVGEEYKELCGTSVNAVGTSKKSGSYSDVLKNASDTIELGRQFKG